MKLKPFHILLADDDESIRIVVRRILAQFGHSVETVTNGKEGIEAYMRDPQAFDMIITDHSMPDVTGLQLVQYVRANGFEGKIIVISGSLTRELEKAYLARSVDKILQKPFTMARLQESLDEIFSEWKNE
ncbi:MAG: response regulator [Chthoniobacteraceae bacterium]